MVRSGTCWYEVVLYVGLYEVVRGGTEWYGVGRDGTMLYEAVRSGTGWFGFVRDDTV